MTVPSYGYGLAGAAVSGLATSAALGKALPIGRDLTIDPTTGDLLVTAGDLPLVTDIDAIRQEAEIRMSFFLGEWFLDVTAGIPYFQSILVKAPNLNAIRSIFIDEVLNVVGIKSVLSMDLSYDAVARKLSVSWAADTDLGELVESTVDFEQ